MSAIPAVAPLPIVVAVNPSSPVKSPAKSPKRDLAAKDEDVPLELRCSYRSKPCQKRRAIKVNGELHKLCDFHRKRANVNQQRVHLRRRISKKQAQQLEALYGPLSGDEAVGFEPSPEPCGDLTLPELQLLEVLLSDNPATFEAFEAAQRTNAYSMVMSSYYAI